MNETIGKQYIISKHAKERYAARVVGKDSNTEIQSYIANNEEKISTDIHKMINYGQLIYTGKQTTKENKPHTIQVFLKDCWVVLLDYNSSIVITLYKVDLGCGDDFNVEYINKMLDKINEAKLIHSQELINREKESNQYKDIIAQNEAMIYDYRSCIKNMEAVNESYRTIVENNNINVRLAERGVADVVNKLIGKKEF